MFNVFVFFAFCTAAVGQSLPDAPHREQVQPFSVGLSLINRTTFDVYSPKKGSRTINDVLPGCFVSYRFAHDRLLVSSTLGRSTNSGDFTISNSLSVRIWKFGRARQ